MRTALFTAATVAALTLNSPVASATDLVNEDAMTYTVTLVDAGGEHTIEVNGESEVLGVCDGCAIGIDGAEPIIAGADDVLVIVDGAMSIQE